MRFAAHCLARRCSASEAEFAEFRPPPLSPDRVFVLADLDIFGSLGQVLMEDIETLGSGGTLDHVDYMSCGVRHAIQAALGAQQCSGQKLADALQVSGGSASVTAPILIQRERRSVVSG